MVDEAKSSSKSPEDTLDLEQFGFVERRRRRREKPGAVAFDDLGNAQYQWTDDRMLEDGAEGDTRRQRALSVANLVLVDDEPPPDQKSIAANKKGLRLGYNPYDSGRLEKQQWKKPRDLRALSKWIESQKARSERSVDDERD